MNPFDPARNRGDKPAISPYAADPTSYAALDEISAKLANWLGDIGLREGDHLAFMLENRAELLAVAWASQRSGLYYTPIPTHLKADEASYIAADCGARVLVTSARFAPLWSQLCGELANVSHWLCVEHGVSGYTSVHDIVRSYPITRVNEREGSAMLYSSGTTGHPKGVKHALSARAFGQEEPAAVYRNWHGLDAESIYLSPAPLYHAAPMRAAMAVQRLGGGVVLLEKFDAETMLAAISHHRVTHVQLVPTMIRRILDLPDHVRTAYDLSSLKRIIHAAAPCPIDLKRAAIEFFGPIVSEYYGGTEGIGMTYITAPEWLERPGSVGRAIVGEVHIVGDDGAELGSGQTGLVYFSGGPRFEYHNAQEKMAEVTHSRGWVTLGDIGRLDDEGYLYLVDRRSFVINSGGVNIYPLEIENVLRTHPDVADAAVIAVPDLDLGEAVKAVVEPRARMIDSAALSAALIDYCRSRISTVKCPRSIDFVDRLPRSDVGKLLKGELKRRYWPPA
jgi:long-chain acyl-CoA synthetase